MRRLLLLAVVLFVGCGEDPPLREATAGERRELDAAVHGWLAAMADGDGKAACSYVSEESLENGPPCEQALSTVRGQLVEEGREEFRSARVKRAFTRGDEAEVTLDARTQYTGEVLTRTFKLVREDDAWKIAGIGLDAGEVGEIPECNVSLMNAWETGQVDRSWRRDGRAMFRRYAETLCRQAAERHLLPLEESDPRSVRLATRIQRRMVRDGLIEPAGG